MAKPHCRGVGRLLGDLRSERYLQSGDSMWTMEPVPVTLDRRGYEYYYGHIDGERREFIRRLDTIPPLHELVHNTLDFYEQEYGVPRYKARNIAAEYVATITLLFSGEKI